MGVTVSTISDSGCATAHGTLHPTVTPHTPSAGVAVGNRRLWPPNGNPINVRLAVARVATPTSASASHVNLVSCLAASARA